MAHLLVVDDESSARTTLALLLRKRGHRVGEAEGVASATKRLAEETFDLPFERLLQDRFVIGTPDDCVDQLLGWRDDLGVNHFIFRPFWSGMPVETALESMDLLSREVLPALRQR